MAVCGSCALYGSLANPFVQQLRFLIPFNRIDWQEINRYAQLIKLFLWTVWFSVMTAGSFLEMWLKTVILKKKKLSLCSKFQFPGFLKWYTFGTNVSGNYQSEARKPHFRLSFNLFTPNDHYSRRTAPLTSKCCTLYIYSTNTGTDYFKHGIYSPFFSLQNAVCFIILTYLVPVLFTFYIEGVLNVAFCIFNKYRYWIF